MRITASILSVYLLVLMVTPCCEFDNCDQTEQSSDHEKKSDNDCNSCSPFFTCNNCTGSVIAIEFPDFSSTTSFISTTYGSYIPSSIPEVHYDFWQPPQLG